MSIEATLKAGAIVIRPGEKEEEILLIFRGRQQDWSFPKGHCEEGESFEVTASREVLEETGIEIRILKLLPSMKYQNPKGFMHVEMFLASPKK